MSTEIDLATELAAVKVQLKEQTQQMVEMASMMKSMMILAMPLLEEQTRKLRKEKEAEAARKKEEEAEAAREEEAKYAMWKRRHSDYWQDCMGELEDEYNRFQHRFAEQNAAKKNAATKHTAAKKDTSAKYDSRAWVYRFAEQMAAKKVVSAKPDSSPDWSCPDDGCTHEWVHAGNQYLRTFEGGIWECNEREFGKWVGQWDWSTKTIDTTVPEPEYDE